MNLKIEPELRKHIWPLRDEEYNLLEANILKDGMLDTIKVTAFKPEEFKCYIYDDSKCDIVEGDGVWDCKHCAHSVAPVEYVIIDGHNRYEIAKKHNIKFEIEVLLFDSIDDVKNWMDANQSGRRNLTKDQWEISIGRQYNRDKNQGERTDLTSDQNDHKSTSERLADQYNISSPTVRRYGKKAEQFDQLEDTAPDLYKAIERGETDFKEIKKEQKQKNLEQKKKQYIEESTKEIVNKPVIKITDAITFLNEFKDDSIDLLITDPPYMTDVDNIHRFTADWLTIAIEKIKRSGRAYICSGAYPEEIYAFLNVLTKQKKFIVDNPLVWTYRNTLGVTPKMKYNLNYQLIWHLYSDESDELDTSVTNEMFSVQDISAPDGRQGNRLHKWQKPDELARRLIRHSTKEEDLVVDCFCCTGTFLIEASRLGRIATGCEISKENAEIAKQRGCDV